MDNKTGEDFYFLRGYETHDKFITYKEIDNYHEEAIFGNWQPYLGSRKKLAVVLNRGGLVNYQIRGPKGIGRFSCLQEKKKKQAYLEKFYKLLSSKRCYSIRYL